MPSIRGKTTIGVWSRCQHCPALAESIFKGTPPGYIQKGCRITSSFCTLRHTLETAPPKKESERIRILKKTKSALRDTLSKISVGTMKSGAFSGETFMSEVEGRHRELLYSRAVNQALRRRNLWRNWHNVERLHMIEMRSTNAGPDWFQDLSPKQMELADNLGNYMTNDMDGHRITQTQQFLHEVGVAPDMPGKIVWKTLAESDRNPIKFLFTIHQRLVELESSQYEKKYFEAKTSKKTISPFSVNERILLTSVFHIHYPEFLKKLDQILPKRPPKPKILWAKKPKKIKKKYSSPYLEPLPINEKPWYEQRAEEELEKKVMKRIRKAEEMDKNKKIEEFLKKQKHILDMVKNERRSMMKDKVQARKQEARSKEEAGKEEETNLLFPYRDRKSLFFKQMAPSEKAVTPEKTDFSVGPSSGVFPGRTFKLSDVTETDTEGMDATSHLTLIVPSGELGEQVVCNVSNACSQTPIKRLVAEMTLYDFDALNPDDEEKEGISEPFERIRRIPSQELRCVPCQTAYTPQFKPFERKTEKEFLEQKERAIGKQKERFQEYGKFYDLPISGYLTEGIFDLERRVLQEEIKLLKYPSEPSLESVMDEEIDPLQKPIPKDITIKEIASVPRSSKKSIQLAMKALMPEEVLKSEPTCGTKVKTPMDSSEEHREDTGTESVEQSVDDIVKGREEPHKEVEDLSPFSQKPFVVECQDPECELVDESELPMDQYTLARKKISLLSHEKQLPAAIRYLCDRGDPLGVLPKIENVPWLVRWFDMRQGIKRNLTETDKDELMRRSRVLWESVYTKCSSIPLPNFPLGRYTWFYKKWLLKTMEERLYKHRREVKLQLVDNARDLFPAMFTEYFPSPLNKAFRGTFYTYFPCRELDSLVVRPWDPNAMENGMEDDNGEGEAHK